MEGMIYLCIDLPIAAGGVEEAQVFASQETDSLCIDPPIAAGSVEDIRSSIFSAQSILGQAILTVMILTSPIMHMFGSEADEGFPSKCVEGLTALPFRRNHFLFRPREHRIYPTHGLPRSCLPLAPCRAIADYLKTYHYNSRTSPTACCPTPISGAPQRRHIIVLVRFPHPHTWSVSQSFPSSPLSMLTLMRL